jgi:hypothetical protein
MGLGGVKRDREAREREEEEKKKKEAEKKGAKDLGKPKEDSGSKGKAQPQPQPLPDRPIGPPERPAPLPDPWARPVFSKPDMSYYEPPAPQQVSRDEPDTRTPSIGYSGPQSDTVSSREEEPSRSPLASLSDRLRAGYDAPPAQQPSSPSLSDRLRPGYDAPNRPIVPTQAQGPAARNPWVSPVLPPQAPYQLQPDEIAPPRTGMGGNTQQQMLNTQGEWGRGIANYGAERQQEVGGAWNELSNWWQGTPEYRMAQERTKDRRAYEPNFPQDVMTGVAAATQGGTQLNPLNILAGAAVGTAIGGMNQFDLGREAVIRGQDVMDRTFEVPGMIAVNAPLPGVGVSVSEVATPAITGWGAYFGNLAANKDTTLNDFLLHYVAQEIGKTQRLRKEVAQEVAAGNSQAALALRNLPSGAEATAITLDALVNNDQKAARLEEMAMQLQATDPVTAGEYFLQAQELRSMTVAQTVDENMNPAAEFAYGMAADPSMIVGPIGALIGFAPEAQALRRAARAMDISPATARANLGDAVQAGKKLAAAMAEGPKAAPKVYKDLIAPFQGVGEKLSDLSGLFARTPESKAALDTTVLWQGLTGILKDVVSKVDAVRVLDTLLTNPRALVEGVEGLSPELVGRVGGPDGRVRWGPGLAGNNDFTRRLPILMAVRDQILDMASLKGADNLNMPEM